jgi:F-type H+-transporting ATPase subunit a
MSTLLLSLHPHVLAADDLIEHVLPHFFNRPEGAPPPAWGFSNHILLLLIAAVLMLLLFSYMGAKAKNTLVPGGMYNFFESILSFLRTELVRPALGANADRFTPFIWTVFFFVLFCNLLGLLPVNEIVSLFRHKRTHVWGTATANFSVTGGLAIMAFLTIHLSGIVQAIRIKLNPSLDPHHHTSAHAHAADTAHGDHLEHHTHSAADITRGQPLPLAVISGIGAYIWNFAPHPQMGNKFVEIAMWLGLMPLELIGAIVKPFSLCVRLFANMVAGHLVLAALISIIPFTSVITHLSEPAYKWGPVSVVVIAGCTALSILELFVAFLQAYIFSFLTTLFIASAVAPDH